MLVFGFLLLVLLLLLLLLLPVLEFLLLLPLLLGKCGEAPCYATLSFAMVLQSMELPSLVEEEEEDEL